MKYLFLTIFAVLLSVYVQGQTDSINDNYTKYSISFKFTDGVFLNFEQAKNNRPIPKLKIVTSIDYNRYDFFERILEEDDLKLYDKLGNIQIIKVEDIWGFANKGVLYINYNDEFNRIPVVGKLSHFIANITYYNNNNYNAYSYNYYNRNPYGQNTTTELRQYLLDFDTGQIFDFNYKNVEIALMKDLEIYNEFVDLRKGKKKKLKFLYVRKFNKKNPLYFPKAG